MTIPNIRNEASEDAATRQRITQPDQPSIVCIAMIAMAALGVLEYRNQVGFFAPRLPDGPDCHVSAGINVECD
jgi:hypothetical protein